MAVAANAVEFRQQDLNVQEMSREMSERGFFVTDELRQALWHEFCAYTNAVKGDDYAQNEKNQESS